MVKIIFHSNVKAERIKMYKITVWKFGFLPDEYFRETFEEAEGLANEFKSFTSSVDIEYIDEGD